MTNHKYWVYRYVRRYVQDQDDAYDILQESFTAAWSALARFDTNRSFTIWLRRIALNKCRDYGRKQKVYKTALSLFGITAGTTESDYASDAPEDLNDAQQTFLKLRKAVATLPTSLRDPLILTAFENLSHKEAGDVLGLSPKAIELRVYRAKKTLETILDRSDLLTISGRSG